MPQDEAQTVYVWFDALIGYLSALLLPDACSDASVDVPEDPVAALVEQGWPADVHVRCILYCLLFYCL